MQQLIKKPFACLLVVTLLTPYRALAEPAAESADVPQPVIREVELAAGGVAQGFVVNGEGQPTAGVVVALHSNGDVFQATTDEKGQFSVSGLHGGSCIVQVGHTPYGARMWAHGTAPPKALKSFVVVNQHAPVVRGASKWKRFQWPKGPRNFKWPRGTGRLSALTGLSQKQLIGLGLGAAVAGATVAIILAIEDDGDASG